MLILGLECLCGISEVPVTDPYNIHKLEKDGCQVSLLSCQGYGGWIIYRLLISGTKDGYPKENMFAKIYSNIFRL